MDKPMTDEEKKQAIKFAGRVAIIAVAGIIGLTVLWGSWYNIDERERGVILRNGRVIGVATPGLGFKIPIVDSVIEISVQTHIVRFDKLQSYSRDQQPADLAFSVNFRASPEGVDDLYSQYGSLQGFEDRVIRPKVMEELKSVFGQYNAVTAIQERARLNSEIRSALMKAVHGTGKGPVVIENAQIENIDFSNAYEKSIEERMLAEVEVQKMRQNAEREKVQADIVNTQAKARAEAVRTAAAGQAEATKLQAEADATAIRLRGEAQALAIKARGDALKDNPGLVALTQAERWDGKLPATMLPGGAVPMLDLRPH